eukprot:1395542-Amorphochlora_amoeboformis.AAC.4
MAPMAINTLSHSHLRLPVQPFKPPQFVPVPSLSRTHFSSRRKLGSLKFRLPLPTATKEDDVAEGQKPYNYEPLSKSQLLSRSYEGSSILRSKSMRRILIPVSSLGRAPHACQGGADIEDFFQCLFVVDRCGYWGNDTVSCHFDRTERDDGPRGDICHQQ